MQNSEQTSDHARPLIAGNPFSLKHLAIAIIISALIFGAGGFLLGGIASQIAHPPLNYKQDVSLYQALHPMPNPTPEPNCFTNNYDAETANWKTYTDTKRHYSFKYPSNANLVIGSKIYNGSYEDYAYISEPISGTSFSQFTYDFRVDVLDTSVVTNDNRYPKFTDTLSNVQKNEQMNWGAWQQGCSKITPIEFQGQHGLLSLPIPKCPSDNDDGSIEFMKDKILYQLKFYPDQTELYCKGVASFKFTDQH